MQDGVCSLEGFGLSLQKASCVGFRGFFGHDACFGLTDDWTRLGAPLVTPTSSMITRSGRNEPRDIGAEMPTGVITMKRLLYTYSSKKEKNETDQPALGKSSAILFETSRLWFELDVLEHIRVPRPGEPVAGHRRLGCRGVEYGRKRVTKKKETKLMVQLKRLGISRQLPWEPKAIISNIFGLSCLILLSSCKV